jgi:hypothetical protein
MPQPETGAESPFVDTPGELSDNRPPAFFIRKTTQEMKWAT